MKKLIPRVRPCDRSPETLTRTGWAILWTLTFLFGVVAGYGGVAILVG